MLLAKFENMTVEEMVEWLENQTIWNEAQLKSTTYLAKRLRELLALRAFRYATEDARKHLKDFF